jgi:tRNA dimethylallyltransferase
MLRLFKRDTRRFAKRQLTWFRRDPRIKWYDICEDGLGTIVSLICKDFADTCRVF